MYKIHLKIVNFLKLFKFKTIKYKMHFLNSMNHAVQKLDYLYHKNMDILKVMLKDKQR